jgi:hypothetical protein
VNILLGVCVNDSSLIVNTFLQFKCAHDFFKLCLWVSTKLLIVSRHLAAYKMLPYKKIMHIKNC